MAEDETNEDEENNEEEEEGSEDEESEEEDDEDEEEEADNDEEKEDSEEDDEDDADDETEANEDAGEDVEVPEEFEDIIEAIEEMSVLELNELVETIEAKFGVEAAAVAAGGGGGDDEEEEEKDAYDISLEDFGDNKIDVIKAVKAALGLGLKEAKDLVENAPSELKSAVPAEEAEEMKEKIEEAGGTVELS